jgi:DNA end-binding protein Ku
VVDLMAALKASVDAAKKKTPASGGSKRSTAKASTAKKRTAAKPAAAKSTAKKAPATRRKAG